MSVDQMMNIVDYLEPGVMRVRHKRKPRAMLVRVTDNGGKVIAVWIGTTKMPPWVSKEV